MAYYEIKDGVGIIPEGEKEIASFAFSGCTSLTSVVIPASVKEIHGINPFSNCPNLTSIVVAEGNEKCDSRNNCNAIIWVGGNGRFSTYLVVGCANTVIPDDVEMICSDAFSGSGITEIEIPDNVKRIGVEAFKDCKELTRVVIPDSITTIESGTFKGCVKLTHVEIPWSVEEIDDSVFAGCTSLTDLVNTESFMEITNCMYQGCTGLTRIEIPAGTTKIGGRAFLDCTNLKEVILPAGIKQMGEKSYNRMLYCFEGCTALESIKVPAKKADYYKRRLPEELHQFIEELAPVKKAKK